MKDKDSVFEFYGVKVFVDPKTALFIQGTEIDYVEGLMASGFKFKNPKFLNAKILSFVSFELTNLVYLLHKLSPIS